MSLDPPLNAATRKLVDELLAQTVGGWKPVRYIARGASALVFEATRDERSAALKVFDPDFLAEHSEDVQVERINRQLELRSHGHPNLIEILDGGQCSQTGFYYLVMPLIRGLSLDKVLSGVPKDRIRAIIRQIASAAQFLETKNFVHRDIKPANIAISEDFNHATLLDLGVVRPLDVSDLTDSTNTLEFVGTTRYSPPELLLRTEQADQEGYRAVTFYQIGAVLHDLLTGRPLFHGRTPYARLVQAVMLETPIIDVQEFQDLVRLARQCLLKDPTVRASLVSWDSFSTENSSIHSVPQLAERIRRTQAAIRRQDAPTTASATLVRQEIDAVSNHLRDHCIQHRELFPPFTTTHVMSVSSGVLAFAIAFAPSSAHGCSGYITVVLQLRASPENPSLFDLGFKAFVSDNALPIDTLDLAPSYSTRSASTPEISSAAERAVYAAFSAALEHYALADAGAASSTPYTTINVDGTSV